MKVLVTGGAGFIGTNLVKRLLKDKYEVFSVDNYSTGFKKNHQEGCRYYNNDLSSDHILGIYVDHGTYPSWRDDDFDIIFHLAALARIQPSLKNPVDTFKSNVLATNNILELARKKNIPVVYAGSSSVHGDKLSNPYTFTKWQGEEVVKMYNELFNLSTVICRFYNVYGKYQATEGAYCNVLGIFEKQFYENKPLTITGNGEQRRDFTDVEDIVDGLIRCGEALLTPLIDNVNGQTFELGTGKNYSINEVANAFDNHPKKYIDSRPGEMTTTLNTDTKAQDLLGWKPKNNIIKYIRENYLSIGDKYGT